MLRYHPQTGQDGEGYYVHPFEWETVVRAPEGGATHTGHAGDTFVVGSGPDLWAKPQTGKVIWENRKLANPRRAASSGSCPVRAMSLQCQEKELTQPGWLAGQGPALSRKPRPRKNSNITCQQLALLSGPQ